MAPLKKISEKDDVSMQDSSVITYVGNYILNKDPMLNETFSVVFTK